MDKSFIEWPTTKLPFTYWLIGFIAVAALHSALVRGVGDVVKAESNYYSTRGRLQNAAAQEAPRVALLGSSITGRIPAHWGDPVVNIGIDGGGPMDSWEFMSSGEMAQPEIIVIEGNTLFAGLHSKSTEGFSSLYDDVMFQVGVKYPEMRASSRPSSLLFNELYQQAVKLKSKPHNGGVIQRPLAMEVAPPERTPKEAERFEQMTRLLATWNASENRFAVVVFYPNPSGHLNTLAGTAVESRSLAKAAGVRFINFDTEANKEFLSFTDGVHLSPVSAMEIKRQLMEELDKIISEL